MNKGAPVYAGSKVVGHVENGVFVKTVSASRHFLRRPPAIANDVAALERAKQLGAKAVLIIDRESKKRYSAGIALVFEKGFEIDRGYGKQVALPLDKWAVE